MKDFIYDEVYAHPIDAVISLTQECNLACRYCFVEKHPNYMTLETAKDIINFILRNIDYRKQHFNSNEINPKGDITFFGGEPCLMYDSIIKPLLLWVNQNGINNQINFSMTTNGTLLNEERIKFLREHNVSLLFSIDGNPTMQNYNRPYKNSNEPSSIILEKNIPILLKYYPNICARMTAYAPTINELYNSYIYFEKKGFKSIAMIPDIRYDWTDEQLDALEEQYNLIFHHRLEQYLSGEYVATAGITQLWEDEVTKFLQSKVNNTLNDKMKIFRCGLGTQTCGINWDGTIYGCQEQMSSYVNGENTIFKIGDIYNGVDIDKHKKLLHFYLENSQPQPLNIDNDCNNCLLQGFCSPGFSCVSSLYDITNSMYKYPKVLCRYHQILFKNTLIKILATAEVKGINFNQTNIGGELNG